jgi:hypothetical protein
MSISPNGGRAKPDEITGQIRRPLERRLLHYCHSLQLSKHGKHQAILIPLPCGGDGLNPDSERDSTDGMVRKGKAGIDDTTTAQVLR